MEGKTKYSNSAKELRILYDVSRPTWLKWLLPIKDKIRRHAKKYKPEELQEIINHLGEP